MAPRLSCINLQRGLLLPGFRRVVRPSRRWIVSGLLCWRDSHPLEWQLASLNGVAGFAAGGSSSDRKRSRPIRAFSATPHDGQRPCRTLAEDPGRTQPRAAYPRRCSSNASGLPGRNSVRILGIRASSAGVARAQASLPRSWPTLRIPNAVTQTRMVSVARLRLDSGNLFDLSKGYFASTFLSSSPTCPATQSGLHQPLADDRRCYRRKLYARPRALVYVC
jgi:hypothetical protein